MNIVGSLVRTIGSSLLESLADQIRVESMIDDRTLVLKDGSMMSMILLDGAWSIMGEEEVEDAVEHMRIALSPYFADPGHALEVNFLRDPDAAQRYLERILNRARRAARNLSMDIEDVLEERSRYLSHFMVAESCLISVFTRPKALEPEEFKDDAARIGKRMANFPPMPGAQVPGRWMDLLYARHGSFLDATLGALKAGGQKVRSLSVREALQEMRAALIPETWPWREEWEPRMPSWSGEGAVREQGRSARLVMAPETPEQMREADYANLAVQTFDVQLATVDSFVTDSRVVRIGNTSFAAFDMTVAPEVLPDFNALVVDITEKSRETPWRATFRMESGGIQAQRLKSMLLSIMTWAAPGHNRRIREAIRMNEEIHGQEDTVVRIRMSFLTWAPASDPLALRRNSQILTGAVKRWGNSSIDGLSGDPMATALSVMPGITTASTAPVASGPMRDVLSMMPISRQASPWDWGAVMLRTPSGKPWPYQPGSSKQTTFVTLFVGVPGSGKSVAMNAINFATAITPSATGDQAVLPRIAIIDIGPSSSGLISMIQESLPADKRHQVLFQKLRMDREFAINVFDTQLGMRLPLSAERTFLINFLTLVCSDGDRPPSSAMRGLIAAAIDQAYRDAMDDRAPRRYAAGDIPEVDNWLASEGIDLPENTIWWEVVDLLMARGKLPEAEAAQRLAVPTLQDLVTAAHAEQIAPLYRDAVDADTGQTVLSSFERMISEVVRDYPILSGATRYSFGSARIVSLDLMDVTARGAGAAARKQTALMYMLARQVLTRDYFIDEAEVRAMTQRGALPRSCEAYHVSRARTNLQIPKLICMDEFHRCGGLEAVTNQVMQDAREGRKFNIDIKIASQLIEDFPQPIIEIASSVIVCNVGSEGSLDYMDRMFRLTENEKRIMRYNLTGPSRRGAPLWALFRTRDGQVRQELVLTLGPVELWSLSTTAEDVALRSLLYEALGPKLARRVLASRFPGGSAKAEIETRVARLEEQGERVDDSGRGNVILQLADEMKLQAWVMSGETVT